MLKVNVLSEDEFKGGGARDFTNQGPAIWQCSDNWAAEGGLLCCDISEKNGDDLLPHNRSCCPDVDPINLFTMNSRPDSATSITLPPLSSTQTPRTQVSESSSSSASLSGSLPSSSPRSSSAATTSVPNNPATDRRTIAIAVSTSVGAVVLIIAGYLYIDFDEKGNPRRNSRSWRHPRKIITRRVFISWSCQGTQNMNCRQDRDI